MATLNGDVFVDILEDRRKTSDIGWASKIWDVPPCRYSQNRTPQEIKQEILNSTKIKCLIKEVSEENGSTEDETRENVDAILDEMSHNFQLRVIRFFGYVLSKFMKSVYGKILVNKKGVEKIASISAQYPILYLPTHRSYSDFLLVSYVCFYFNLPVPVIAAGLDFLGLKAMTFLLRGAGAFFIRRSFVGDRLYKEVFTEYVQTHIEGCEYPMEFFIEGTRSRTAKSLLPKLGMLQAILELFFTSKIPDITVVPISISYDQTLEETLYAYELLGVPKPKESTRGLIKARRILSHNYGNVHIRFGEHISLKEYFRNYDRSVHNLHPRNLSISLKEEQILCRDLANHVIRMHQCNLIISPFPLVCLVISQPTVINMGGMPFDHLVDFVSWLEDLIRRTGATIYNDGTPAQGVRTQLKMHSNIIDLSSNSIVSLRNCTIEHPVAGPEVKQLNRDTVKKAIPTMFAYHYGNQALQLLVHACMICMAVGNDVKDFVSRDTVFFRYQILRKLLQKEFVFERMSDEKDFAHSLDSLKEEHILVIEEAKIFPCTSGLEKIEFLRLLLLPFLESYNVICQFLIHKMQEIEMSCKALAQECQAQIEKEILEGKLANYQCLSLDIVNNCVSFLLCQEALHKILESDKTFMLPDHSKLASILLDIEIFLPETKNNSSTSLPVSSAKL